MANNTLLNIRLDEATKEKLRLMAEKNCRSMAEQVKFLIREAAEVAGTK